jgi:hypothetical protein
MPWVRCVLVATAALLLASVSPSTAKRSRDVDPYRTFHFTYTKTHPGVATGLRYRVALQEQGAKAPVVERLDLTFAKGSRVDLGAVKACRATDAEIQQQGPGACPAKGRIATGKAKVHVGGPSPLELAASVSATGTRGVAVVLANGATVVRILRGTLSGRTLTVRIPALTIGETRVALVAFDLDIAGGTASRPVFRTPKTCTPAGWDVTYAPTFVSSGRVKLVDSTRCRP